MVRRRSAALLSAAVVGAILMILLGLLVRGLDGIYFDCDPVNHGHYCICAKGDSETWDVQCPARILEVYPVSLKISTSSSDPEQANLRVICDPDKDNFEWRHVQGLNLENENISFTVTRVEISYCPPINTTDLQTFFQQMKLDPKDIQSFSYITWRNNITFPTDLLTFMPNLEAVDLRNNKLEKLPSFQALLRLSQLNLRGNFISVIPPDTFATNTNLEQIRLGGNSLSKLNEPIFPASLALLDLVDNQITIITNETFSNLKDLQVLYLNNNPLERVEIGAFSQLKNLTELSLDYSKLFSLPLLTNLPKLTNLSISYSLFTSTKLVTTTDTLEVGGTTEIDMKNTNFYSSTAPATSVMDDDSNAATTGSSASDDGEGVINDEMGIMGPSRGRSDLFDDYVDNNDEEKELIGNLFSLKKLILINDDLKTLSWLGYLPNLTDLVLSRNELRSFPEGFFRNLPNIKHVDVSKNSISTLSEIEAPLLTYLDISNNFVRFLDKDHFRQLRSLRVLLMGSNKLITTARKETIESCIYANATLGFFQIEYIHHEAFENLGELVILDFSNNRISFSHEKPTLLNRRGIQYDLMTTTLVPSTTEVSESDEDAMNANNPPDSPLQYCTKLERINLRNNLISKVFMDWTFVPENLKILDLSHNKIKSLHPRDLYFVAQDVKFDLRYNEISDVDMDFAELLLEPLENKNIVVLLDGNPLRCDCQAVSFKQFSIKSYRLVHPDLRCAYPENLKGKRFHEVPVKDLRCMVTQGCPVGCSCWELTSENLIKMECPALEFETEGASAIKNFTEIHDPVEIEIDLSGRSLITAIDSLITEISSQVRMVNLTNSNLTSMDFLDTLEANNYTQFALSNNPFICDGCKFQKTWWKHYKRILDVRSITCIVPENNSSSTPTTLFFYDLVKDTICAQSSISDEIRFLIIIIGVVIPIVFVILVCFGKQQLVRDHAMKKSHYLQHSTSTMKSTRAYTPTRSKVAEMDNSKF